MVLTADIIPSPVPPKNSELQRIRADDQRCCRNLIDRWETPVKVIASGYTSRNSDLDDLMQIGRVAVYQAALKYKPSFQVPFANYTKRAIKNSVMKEAARLDRQRKFETPLNGNSDQQAEIKDHADQTDPVKEWVRELPEPHATIFRLLYVEQLKQRPAAREMGVSQPRVAQLHMAFLNLARETFAG